MIPTYIILWKNNKRIASIDNTFENLAELKRGFCLSLIQQDQSGTEHYEVLGRYKKHRKQERRIVQ